MSEILSRMRGVKDQKGYEQPKFETTVNNRLLISKTIVGFICGLNVTTVYASFSKFIHM